MTTTIERLEELLDQKDQELEKQSETIDSLRRQLEFGVDWMLHSYVKDADDNLPVPRIELHITVDERCYQESQITLVLQQRDGTRSRVPLSYAKRSGSLPDFEDFPTEGEVPDQCVNKLPSHINDICFFVEKTNLPGYVVLDPERQYRLTSLRPLKMVAVNQGTKE